VMLAFRATLNAGCLESFFRIVKDINEYTLAIRTSYNTLHTAIQAKIA